MTSALLRLALTPALIAVATLVSRRWGPAVGGAVVGLPLTSAPVSLFLALDHGPAFAATAAVATLLGLLSQAAVCLTFAWVGRRAGWPLSAAAGVAAFAASTRGPESSAPDRRARVRRGVGGVACRGLAHARRAAGASRLFPAAVGPAGAHGSRGGDRRRADRRGGTAGPRWTGLLSPFPVFALVLGSFTHRAEGPAAAAALLRGIVVGSLSHATMFALIAVLLGPSGLAVDLHLGVRRRRSPSTPS